MAVESDMERGRFVRADSHADIAVVVVTYNNSADIPLLLNDLRAAAVEQRIRVIVVDNVSSDGTAAVVRAEPDVVLIESPGNLGYAGGINAGLSALGPCDAMLILNPDLRIIPGALGHLFAHLMADPRVGVVVPRILDANGDTYPSLRREPTVSRACGDAVFGSRIWPNRPSFLSETDYRATSYTEVQDVDWATGAALLVRASVLRQVGEWNEAFFLFSEETDFCRRVRESGFLVRFVPEAVVQHRQGGSGTSAFLTLMVVNRIRYMEFHHGRLYTTMFRAAVALTEALRANDPVHRHTLGVVLDRRQWAELPRATKSVATKHICGPRRRGSVIIPAYNEAAVIKRTLTPLSQAAVDGFIDLIVVCNGCTDRTAEVARTVPGVRVLELEHGSKPAALNAGDEAATLWPRLYVDADIRISAAAAVAVLDRLTRGDVLAARPASRYDTAGASWLVRSYHRARSGVPEHKLAMWGAGVYGLNADGHERIGSFPAISGDDLFVDTRFDAAEKAVVEADPAIVTTPTNAKSLVAIMRRFHRGADELRTVVHAEDGRVPKSGLHTALSLARTISGPLSALDAMVYLSLAFAARLPSRRAVGWARDESSRS